MRPLTEQDIRNSFVNCSKGEAKRMFVPHDLGERPWDDLDFLGWRDPGAPDRSCLKRVIRRSVSCSPEESHALRPYRSISRWRNWRETPIDSAARETLPALSASFAAM